MSFIDKAVCAYIYFLTTRRYACMFPEYDVPVRYNHTTIPFEVHAPISFYEKTCGKGSNIIEAISIHISKLLAIYARSLSDQRWTS